MKKINSNKSRLEVASEGPIEDIVQAIKDDHKALRKFGKVLTSEDSSESEKKEAYKNFSTLLKSHAKSEEKAVYQAILKVEDLKLEANEGFVEHNIADTLMKNIAATRNKDKWEAMVKVLAEIVEHHADEEEKELLPKISKDIEETQQDEMSVKFLRLREQSQTNITEDNAGVLAKVLGEGGALDKSA